MNLWILTEERPKKEVLEQIFKKFAEDKGISALGSSLQIFPILKDNQFTFIYEVIGFRCNIVDKIYIKTVKGKSSFVDFIIFYQNNEPTHNDIPLYLIEETKTDDKESRNTGVYQRCSKFIFSNYYYPNVKKIMLYNLKVSQKEKPTDTYIFGTRLLLTLGVEIIGKNLDKNIFKPFNNILEVIEEKENMRLPNKTNIPILITKSLNSIMISGRLIKSGSLSHDPNIGALTIISAVLRKLGWDKDIIITSHGLSQQHLKPKNKFIQIADQLDIKLEGLELPLATYNEFYWEYDFDGEKLGTIFIHILVENFTNGDIIFENHAGCEKSYFLNSSGEYLQLEKYSSKEEYKAGDKTKILHIPDLIIIDFNNSEIINIEGKKYKFKQQGIKELDNYDYIEERYIKKYYSDFKIIRTVVLYGSDKEEIIELEVGFLLNKKGSLILGVKAPNIFKVAVFNLLNFWKEL